ncbi:MAG: hypothetical protein A2845_01735 [Candidatus Lloydbacteria bacterium RIFCSPHIGHO2_01_FULL_49_22]|uniref:Uncharacterized protein n=1 Tax=Candidatus Lloydbacteria bacterium RIFCSPHIGHO2_01_FULL_49_22 TaxID=1798658 RepID=A0A1G2D042_9BACT|nr:MAG: hypothetical protein A2845_01735 [Candidatus Lloydbacteria bacterium RIFCSPHIGHO2_01_FULL_49_22]OGZ10019.1 MAG: hypothetical protein A3C14_04900 [Candidatus Lloydbacteria bacterium RIFCSPHIGHO2_02_FULL_50_18]
MQNEEWQKVARLAGYVYIPLGLFILFVYLLIQYQSLKIERATIKNVQETIATTTEYHIAPEN